MIISNAKKFILLSPPHTGSTFIHAKLHQTLRRLPCNRSFLNSLKILDPTSGKHNGGFLFRNTDKKHRFLSFALDYIDSPIENYEIINISRNPLTKVTCEYFHNLDMMYEDVSVSTEDEGVFRTHWRQYVKGHIYYGVEHFLQRYLTDPDYPCLQLPLAKEQKSLVRPYIDITIPQPVTYLKFEHFAETVRYIYNKLDVGRIPDISQKINSHSRPIRITEATKQLVYQTFENDFVDFNYEI